METDAEKQKEEPAVDDSAAATAVSKADTSQVWNNDYSLKFKWQLTNIISLQFLLVMYW